VNGSWREDGQTLQICSALRSAYGRGQRVARGPPRWVLIRFLRRRSAALTLVATSLSGQFGAWILSSGPVNAAGQPVSTTPAACTAPSIENNPPDFDGCLTSQGIREAISYQPASRYWPFQWTETAIYLALALALAGYCFRRLNRRRS
jgi:hypothetical protein